MKLTQTERRLLAAETSTPAVRWTPLLQHLAAKEAKRILHGSRPCGCGRTISANKSSCLACATAAAAVPHE